MGRPETKNRKPSIIMNGFELFTSNRIEHLTTLLAATLAEPLDPLRQDHIVVQSRGMERYLSMQLAARTGVCANVAFPFPAGFMYDLFRMVLPDLPASYPLGQPVLTWKILELLPALRHEPEFGPLQGYVDDSDSLKQLQLAEKLAYLFDRYLIFRPEMIEAWERDELSGTSVMEHEAWQKRLWRESVRGHEREHRVALKRRFLKALEKGKTGSLPSRIVVFGISSLPSYHLEILHRLTGHARVSLYFLNPSREWWGDALSDRARAGLERRGRLISAGPGETGNSLLSSLGTLGRDFHFLLEENSLIGTDYPLFPDEFAAGTLLGMLQEDIRDFQNRRDTGGGEITADDFSIQVHSCHSPMREMEVLRDRLLDLFETRPDMDPSDVLVMCPDIESYAPYVQAVFGTGGDRIPFRISDRSVAGENLAVRAFFEILDLPGSRFEASRLLGLLDVPPVAGTFGLSEGDRELVRTWVRDTGIRWGVDGTFRAGLGLPGYEEYSWKSGLERILYGFLCPGTELFENRVVPYDLVEGGQAQTLGRFLEFVQVLAEAAETLEGSRTMPEWRDLLTQLVDRCLGGRDSEEQVLVIGNVLSSMVEETAAAGYSGLLDLDGVRHLLQSRLAVDPVESGFLSGGVTFCTLIPMRSIPFRVVCLVGMNDTSFPRKDTRLGFDLMAASPMRGDRSLRMDDRYQFLEAILSAREVLYLSHVGRSIRDNSEIPPSVLVAELMDHVRENYVMDGGDPWARLRVEHPLQPFHPSYFTGEDDRLFSYSGENCRGAQSLRQPGVQRPFMERSAPVPEDPALVSLEDLSWFLAHPPRFFVRSTLKMFLVRDEESGEDLEPLVGLNKLEEYVLGGELLDLDGDDETVLTILRGRNMLPPENIGRQVLQGVRGEVLALRSLLEDLVGEQSPGNFSGSGVRLGDRELQGRLDRLYPAGLVRFRFATVKPKDLLSAWVDHLFLNCFNITGSEPVTYVLGRKDSCMLQPVEDAREILDDLVRLYVFGRTRPLPFFPAASMAWAEAVRKGKGGEMEKARRKWEGGWNFPGEMEDAYNRLCFRDDPLDEEFEELAERVFGVLLEHKEKL